MFEPFVVFLLNASDSFMFKVNDGKADGNTAFVTIGILTQEEWLTQSSSSLPSTASPGDLGSGIIGGGGEEEEEEE